MPIIHCVLTRVILSLATVRRDVETFPINHEFENHSHNARPIYRRVSSGGMPMDSRTVASTGTFRLCLWRRCLIPEANGGWRNKVQGCRRGETRSANPPRPRL